MKQTTEASRRPRRQQRGDLIVLNLYGSYRQMGRQQVELLGPIAREMYDLQRSDWSALIGGFGAAAKAGDALLPRFWMAAGPRYEKSGLYDEIAGMALGLGVSASAGWRGVFGGLGGATTTFLATRTATADGTPIMGKNSDWPDRYGRRPPLLTHYHPSNGDLAHIMAGWPLSPLAATGLNEAGLAIGMNFFNADQVLSLGLPRWPYRRVLQAATTVDEGIRIIQSSPDRGISGFISMADAGGDIALMECTPRHCEVFRPEGDWFAQSNHARTEKMMPHDRGRSLDSFTRRAAMESVLPARLGKVTPETAAEIMRDRSNTAFANESCIANASVFHTVVVHPASKTLWHSTARQPLAPFGELAPFSPGVDASPAAALPADPRFGTPAMQREAEVVAELRRAVRLFDEGSVDEAAAIWDRLAGANEPLVKPHRLAWARARAQWTLGRLQEALDFLAPLDSDDVPFDVRVNALVAAAAIADRLGDRPRALELYRRADDLFRANPDYNDGLVAPLKKRIAAGLRSPQTAGPIPSTPALQRLPG